MPYIVPERVSREDCLAYHSESLLRMGVSPRGAGEEWIEAYLNLGVLEVGHKHYNVMLEMPDHAMNLALDEIGQQLGVPLNTDKRRQAFRVLCLNLILNKFSKLYIRLDKAFYGMREQYNRNHVSLQSFKTVLNHLTNTGQLIYLPGDRWCGRTVIAAQGEFVEKLKIIAEDVCASINDNSPCVVLRKKIGKNVREVEYSLNREKRRNITFLKRYNRFIKDADISFSASDIPPEVQVGFTSGQKDTVKYCNPAERRLTRIYSGNFNQGGRFYRSFWVGLPKEARKFIRINGNATVEADYKNLHPNMLYLMATGRRYQGDDAYSITDSQTREPYLRKLVKLALNVMLNCTHRQQAIKAIENVIIEEELPVHLSRAEIGRLVDDILAAHPAIRDYFLRGRGSDVLGLKLQYHDSQIADTILRQAYEDGVVALPIHDSFQVEESKQEYLVNLMAEKMYNYFINQGTISRDSINDFISMVVI